MASVTHNFMKLFRGSSSGTPAETPQAVAKADPPFQRPGRTRRACGSLKRRCVFSISARLLPTNIRFFTERAHKIYSEDLLVASTEPHLVTKDEQGKSVLDSRRFLADNLLYPAAQFDVVLCWNLPDYLDESLVRPVMGRLWSVLKPGGMLLAFFHTKDAGPDSPCYRFHIVGKDTLEMQRVIARREARRGPTGAIHTAIIDGFRLQRVFNNRHIETLFRDFASIKFFLARDNVREVLVVR